MPPINSSGAVTAESDDAQEVDRLDGEIDILVNENSAIFQDSEIGAGSAGAINTTNNANAAPVSNPGEVFRSTDYAALSASFDDGVEPVPKREDNGRQGKSVVQKPNASTSKRAVVPIQIIGATFEYEALAPALANDLRARAERIRTSISGTIDTVIAIGNELLAAKEYLDHGQFQSWVEHEVGIQRRTARNYMSAARLARFHKRETVSLLCPGAVYRLAAPSTPPQVVDAVLRRVEAGELMSDGVVAAIVSNARRQQHRIDPDAEARRRRSKECKDEQQARVEKHRQQQTAHRATCLGTAKTIHERLGTDTCIWLQKVLGEDPWGVLSALDGLVGGGAQ
jgi:Protein of unknown function (DUF3102)